jgi:hypothetical protein
LGRSPERDGDRNLFPFKLVISGAVQRFSNNHRAGDWIKTNLSKIEKSVDIASKQNRVDVRRFQFIRTIAIRNRAKAAVSYLGASF